jgi:hypothetical protein
MSEKANLIFKTADAAAKDLLMVNLSLVWTAVSLATPSELSMLFARTTTKLEALSS